MYTQITRIASMATVVLALPRIARMAAAKRLSLSRVATKALRGVIRWTRVDVLGAILWVFDPGTHVQSEIAPLPADEGYGPPTPKVANIRNYTLYPAPFTLHPTLYTLHPAPYTLHPTRYTLGTLPDWDGITYGRLTFS